MKPNEDYERMLKVWQDAVAASERHLKIAAQLQRAGLETLKGEGKEEDAYKPLEAGVAMERAAYKELISLHFNKPRKPR